jgi:chromatin segregation and condensation protein Rec8/ScpA/Scc1 (kleisin family)
MKFAKTLFLFLALLTPMAAVVRADDKPDAAQTVDVLRLQLLETEAKEAELEARAKQLDEDLKPENIARALAGIGSTRPEELRETRRRQLTIERDSVRVQLNLVAKSKERLEVAIRTAENRAYQQSAQDASGALNQTLTARSVSGSRVALLIFAGVTVVALILGLVLVIKRHRLV